MRPATGQSVRPAEQTTGSRIVSGDVPLWVGDYLRFALWGQFEVYEQWKVI